MGEEGSKALGLFRRSPLGRYVRLAAAVILLVLLALASYLTLRGSEPPRPRALSVAVPGSGSSRFLIEPYALPGPIPLESLSPKALSEFTLGGKVPTHGIFRRDVGVFDLKWTDELIDGMVELARGGDPEVNTTLCPYGPPSNKAFFEALAAYPVEGQNVLVVGSVTPWLESFCLAYKANSTTTVDFNPPSVRHVRMRSMSIPELDTTDEVFDSVFSYSSLEHDGLGRYGDPLHAEGDLFRMKKLMGLLRPGGKLFLGVPNGPDFLLFNAHRVYGRLRFPLLIEGWKLLGTFGDDIPAVLDGRFSTTPMCIPAGLPDALGCYSQPVHVLALADDNAGKEAAV